MEHPSGNAPGERGIRTPGRVELYGGQAPPGDCVTSQTHPGAYVLRSLRHVLFMWTGFWSFDRDYLRQEPFDPETSVFSACFPLLSFHRSLLSCFARVEARRRCFICLVLLSFPIPYYLSHLDPGFRHPVDPLLVILACFCRQAIPRSNPRAGHAGRSCRTCIALASGRPGVHDS